MTFLSTVKIWESRIPLFNILLTPPTEKYLSESFQSEYSLEQPVLVVFGWTVSFTLAAFPRHSGITALTFDHLGMKLKKGRKMCYVRNRGPVNQSTKCSLLQVRSRELFGFILGNSSATVSQVSVFFRWRLSSLKLSAY